MNKNYMHTGKCTAKNRRHLLLLKMENTRVCPAHRQITTLSSDHQTLTKSVILSLPTYMYLVPSVSATQKAR
jgi:hypothetical protein